jgi:hypothetical protein
MCHVAEAELFAVAQEVTRKTWLKEREEEEEVKP